MKFAALAFAMVGGIAIGSLFLVALIPGFLCENTLVEDVLSPDKKMKAVVFQRECTSSRDYTTQVSINPANAELPNGIGNVFIANTNNGAAPNSPLGGPSVKVRWRTETFLELSHHPDAKVFLSETFIDDITVEYEKN
ncbi:MAG: hypothetical protein O7G86_04850 [Gammaproteobacteria bacterium]|nr:hypothetical protein [Gammaproteobacteria bacterium]